MPWGLVVIRRSLVPSPPASTTAHVPVNCLTETPRRGSPIGGKCDWSLPKPASRRLPINLSDYADTRATPVLRVDFVGNGLHQLMEFFP